MRPASSPYVSVRPRMGFQLDIAPAATNYSLSNNRAVAAFTVTNRSGRAFRGNIFVRPSNAAHASWYKVQGDADRLFAADTPEKISVEIHAPADAPADTYSFVVRVVSEANTDEDWADSPSVSFVVATAEREGPPKWLPFVIAGAVLAVGGGVLALVFLQPDPPPRIGEACLDKCATGLECFEKICKVPLDGSCSTPGQCASSYCSSANKCSAGPKFGEACTEVQPCLEGLSCAAGLCRRNVTEPCVDKDNCATSSCFRGKCSTLYTSCDKNPCEPDQVCAEPSRQCRLKDGEVCNDFNQCASTYCAADGRCAAKPQCQAARDCRGADQICVANSCFTMRGGSCGTANPGAGTCEYGSCEGTRCSRIPCSRGSCPGGFACNETTGRCEILMILYNASQIYKKARVNN